MHRLHKSQRLLRPSEFQNLYRHGRKRRNQGLTVYFKLNALDNARVGIAISKRVCPLAVERNRLKRLIRESFRHCHELPSCDFMVTAFPEVRTMTNHEIFESLQLLWKQCQQCCAEG